MGRPIVDLSNKRFGRLLVIEQIGRTTTGNVRWKCVCDCGSDANFAGGDLRRGNIISCGCYRHELLIRGSKPIPIEQKFWKYVNKTDYCWLWTGATTEGRGIIGIWDKHTTKMAYRVSWEIHNGAIPKGLNVCHHCDNPICVRPDHLFLGTQLDNIHNSISKGRMFWQKSKIDKAIKVMKEVL